MPLVYIHVLVTSPGNNWSTAKAEVMKYDSLKTFLAWFMGEWVRILIDLRVVRNDNSQFPGTVHSLLNGMRWGNT